MDARPDSASQDSLTAAVRQPRSGSEVASSTPAKLNLWAEEGGAIEAPVIPRPVVLQASAAEKRDTMHLPEHSKRRAPKKRPTVRRT
jgi:hypothetical protein